MTSLSTAELRQRILEMAQSGVYRQSIFEALRPYARRRQISIAIASARRFGLHSVANLRDPQLGTYYELDTSDGSIYPPDPTPIRDLLKPDPAFGPVRKEGSSIRLTVQWILWIPMGTALVVLVMGMLCLALDSLFLGVAFCFGSGVSLAIWIGQRILFQRSFSQERSKRSKTNSIAKKSKLSSPSKRRDPGNWSFQKLKSTDE
jgi:hypothetical protein